MHHLLTSRRRAFSLIELAVVLIVVAVIAAVAIPTFQATIQASDESAAEAEVNSILRNAVAIARVNGRLAPNQSDLQTAFDESATATDVGLSAAAAAYAVCAEDVEGQDCTGDGVDVWWSQDGSTVGVVVDDTVRVLGRTEGSQVTDTWADQDGTLADALAGPTGAPQATPAATLLNYTVFGSGAIDDLRATSGSGDTGPDLYLSESFASDGPLTTGTPVEYLISDTAPGTPNTHPITGGFGVPPNTWADVSNFNPSGWSTPSASGGAMYPGAPETASSLVYDLFVGNVELSFEVAELPGSGGIIGVQVTDLNGPGGSIRQLGTVQVFSGGAQLWYGSARVHDDLVPVSVGDRIGLRRVGDQYQLRVNGVTRQVVDESDLTTVSATITSSVPGADLSTCNAELWAEGTYNNEYNPGPVSQTVDVASDGSFSVTSIAPVANLRVWCEGDPSPTGGTAWWYGGGFDWNQAPATELDLTGASVDLGTVAVG